MKIQHLPALALAAILAAAAPLHSQTFNAASGFSSTRLFSAAPGVTISGLDADAAGNVYTIEGAFRADTILYRRSAADGYATATALYNLGRSVFGTFVRVRGDTLYFGESTNSLVFSKSVSDTDTSSARIVGTVGGNFDLTFSGATAFISYDPVFNSETKVAILDLDTGGLDVIVDTGNNGMGDASGPIAFDARGALYYGATTFGTNPGTGGIFQFDAASVAGAAGPAALTLPTTAYIDNGSNQYLNSDGGTGLFQIYSPGVRGIPATVSLYDVDTRAAAPVGSTGGGEFFGGTGFASGTLFTALTNNTFTRIERVRHCPRAVGPAPAGAGFSGPPSPSSSG